jgi:hypothetical protein
MAPASGYGQQDGAPGDSPGFALLKQLVGRWEGTTDDGDTKAVITYKLTGRNTSIVETLFPGTPMEMMTIYHDNAGGKLVAKHFCVAMNQPQLHLTRASHSGLFFEHSPNDPNVDEATEHHGHDLAITVEGEDKLHLEWFNWKNGGAVGSRRYEFTKIE